MKLTDEELKQLQDVAAASGEQIEKSEIFLSLLTKNYAKDPVAVLQLGIAILLDKPIAVIAVDGEPIPTALKRLAFHTEDVKFQDKAGLSEATARIVASASKLQEKEESEICRCVKCKPNYCVHWNKKGECRICSP